jgi:Holliday junction resolvase RusA-like endonuclease
MDAPVFISVPGAITPWKRAQRQRFANGGVRTFTDAKVEAYHAVVRMAAERAMGGRAPIVGPVELTVRAVFAVPPSWSGKKRKMALAGLIHKTSRPDLDNSIKGAKDAMQSIVYVEDSQIVRYADCAKVYGERPRLDIIVSPVRRLASQADSAPGIGPLFAA